MGKVGVPGCVMARDLLWSLNPPECEVAGGGSEAVYGHKEYAENSVPFNVPSERAQLTPGTNKSRGTRLC